MGHPTLGFRPGGSAGGALIGALFAFQAPFALADTALSVGAEYATGDYGTNGDDVEDVYVPVTLEIEGEKLLFSLTVPYAAVDGPEGSVLVSGAVVPGQGPNVSESGLGDVLASLTVKDLFVSRDGSIAVDLTGTVKLGTADEDKGLGTGENDYSALVDVYKLLDRATLYASAGYTVRGDPNEYDLDNTWFLAAGSIFPVGPANSLGIGVNYRPEVVSHGDPASEASLFGVHELGSGRRLYGYVLAGLADGSPDWGVGVRFRVPF